MNGPRIGEQMNACLHAQEKVSATGGTCRGRYGSRSPAPPAAQAVRRQKTRSSVGQTLETKDEDGLLKPPLG